MSRRTHRVEDVLRGELSTLILRELQDPRVALTSVTRVEVSPDLRNATAWISVLPEGPEREEALEALRHASGFLRKQLARRLRHMRAIPELTFRLDRGAEHSQHLTDLLEELQDDDQPNP